MLRAMSSYVYINKRLHPGLLDEMARGGAQADDDFLRPAMLPGHEPPLDTDGCRAGQQDDFFGLE